MKIRSHFLIACLSLSQYHCSENKSSTPIINEPSACTTDGQTACMTTDAFPATTKADLVAKAAEYRSSLTIAGVSGTLADCAADNASTCVTTDAYPAINKSSLAATSIKAGVVVAGITGTFAPPCSADAQIDCLTITAFPAGNMSAISTFDFRSGETFGGIAGKIVYNRNGAETASWNRTSGTGAIASAGMTDPYDTLDDYNNGGALPATRPSGWPILSENFVRDAASDTNANSMCDGAEECVLKDANTGLYWAKANAGTANWETSIGTCDALNYGTYTNWRLPTQKELIGAYIASLYAQRTPLGLNGTPGASDFIYLSATTDSLDTTKMYRVNIATGEVTTIAKTTALQSICVR